MKKIFVKKETTIPFTREGYENVLQEQKKYLEERPSAVENLRKAREMGDLSENGYYKASRARLSFIDAQLRRLDRLRKLGRIVSSSGTDHVDIGNTVRISDGGREETYMIVGGYESDPSKKTISHLSPIGKALMNRHVGQTVTVVVPVGIKTYTILSIE